MTCTGGRIWASAPSTTSPDTAARGRCASATGPAARHSSTSTARSCSPRTTTWRAAAGCCWLALDRLLDLPARRLVRVPVDQFRRERAAIAGTIETRGFNPALSSYVAELDGDAPDAS